MIEKNNFGKSSPTKVWSNLNVEFPRQVVSFSIVPMNGRELTAIKSIHNFWYLSTSLF